MTAAVAVLLVLLVAVFVVLPLLRGDLAPSEGETTGSRELWTREKATAVLAITEADFDRATGKLSDDDYQVLRSDYEGRALQAMDELERQRPASPAVLSSPSAARFCASCGSPFGEPDFFCNSCGKPRHKS